MYRLITLFAFIALLTSCSSYNSSNASLASLTRTEFLLQPEYRVYHESLQKTSIYFQVKTGNLLYTRSTKNNEFAAQLNLNIKVFQESNDGKKQTLIYQDSSLFVDYDNGLKNQYLIGKFEMPIAAGSDYLLKLTISDKNRNASNDEYITIRKKDRYLEQAILPVSKESMAPVIAPKLNRQDTIILQKKWKNDRPLFGWFIPNTFKAPPPPFMSDQKFNSEFGKAKRINLHLTSNDVYAIAPGDTGGIYIFQHDTSEVGFKLPYFPNGFPEITNYKMMADAMIYICSKDEYQKIQISDNKRLAIENFWIKQCGSKDRARRIIREYFNRVEKANKYFTNYKEGWKTDRGMIYVIFGPPNTANKRSNYETWAYGREANMTNLSFSFRNIPNLITENNYLLDRGIGYRQIWYTAVDTWRGGRVFNY